MVMVVAAAIVAVAVPVHVVHVEAARDVVHLCLEPAAFRRFLGEISSASHAQRGVELGRDEPVPVRERHMRQRGDERVIEDALLCQRARP